MRSMMTLLSAGFGHFDSAEFDELCSHAFNLHAVDLFHQRGRKSIFHAKHDANLVHSHLTCHFEKTRRLLSECHPDWFTSLHAFQCDPDRSSLADFTSCGGDGFLLFVASARETDKEKATIADTEIAGRVFPQPLKIVDAYRGEGYKAP